jgi:hypothetical protein
LFVCDEKNLDISKNIKLYKLEDIEKPKKYDLKKYLDDSCINIINNIYSKDFLFFNYEMKNSVYTLEDLQSSLCEPCETAPFRGALL